MKKHELIISEEVTSGIEECLHITPEAGNTVWINHFHASGAAQPDAVIKLIWDYAGPGEKVLWTIKTDAHMPKELEIKKADVDGVKKLALCLENSSANNMYLSAFAEIVEM